MAFKQFTRCIQPSEYQTMNRFLLITIQSLLVGGTATAIVIAAAANPVCIAIAVEITGLAWVIAYCRHFLFQRLICLGGDKDAIGVIANIEPAADRSLTDSDTDYCVNLILEPNEFGVTQAEAENSNPYGFLIHAQDGVKALGLPTAGYPLRLDMATGKHSAVLHVEFEGAGVRDLLLGAEAGFGLAVAALIACIALPGPVGLILAGLALLALIIGGLFTTLGDEGSPTDVNPTLGNLQENTEENGGYGKGADILYVQGTWVYDPVHTGWNEIHPVKVATKIGCWDGDWTATPDNVILRVREGFRDARAETTLANQKLPEHQWTVHPGIDGCASNIIT